MNPKRHDRGIWCLNSSIAQVRLLCLNLSLDTLLFDLEHSSYSSDQLAAFIDICRLHRKKSIIRVAENSQALILHAFELAPDFIMVPSIGNTSALSESVSFFCPPPIGIRGYSPYSYAANAPKHLFSPTKLIIQIETPPALENIHHLLQINGFDGVFFGRYDLSMHYQCAVSDLSLSRKITSAAELVKQTGRCVGTVSISDDEEEEWSSQFDFLTRGSDSTLVLG